MIVPEEEMSDEEFWAPVRQRNVGDLCRDKGCHGILQATGHMLVCDLCNLLVEPGPVAYYDEVADFTVFDYDKVEQRLHDAFLTDTRFLGLYTFSQQDYIFKNIRP